MSSIDQDSKLVEAVARGMVEPLGFNRDADWERIWVGDIADTAETGSLAYMCRALARAIIPIVRKSVLEEAAECAEHLNGWGSPRAPDLAAHIAQAIRSLASDVKEEGW